MPYRQATAFGWATATEEEAKKAGANLIKKVSVQFVKSAEMGRAFSLDELSFVQG